MSFELLSKKQKKEQYRSNVTNINFECYEEESAMKTISFYRCKFCSALLKPLGTEVTISLIAYISSMHNVSLKAGLIRYVTHMVQRNRGGDIKIEMTIKTKRASRAVPAEPSDGERLLIVLKPSSAWRQGIPYDKPHVPELAPDVALFDKYKKT